jgi:tRNA(Phe) wybutosine-synthesizing methylase Tyw3
LYYTLNSSVVVPCSGVKTHPDGTVETLHECGFKYTDMIYGDKFWYFINLDELAIYKVEVKNSAWYVNNERVKNLLVILNENRVTYGIY